MSTFDTLRLAFENILPANLVLEDDQSRAFYGRDWIKDFPANPSLVLLPETVEQVQQIVRTCSERGIAVVPSGGRTGLSGGATATNREVVISLERMRRILEVTPVDRTIRVESGVVLERLQNEATNQGLYFPVDFSSRGSSQIGGNIATNAGGIRVIKYGNIRDWVVGLKVVTGHGDLLDLNGSLFKNNTGYDFRSLFIGSEGTLGIIVEATLRLTTPPGDVTRILCGLSDTEAIIPLLGFCRSRLRDLSAFEFMERSVVDEVVKRRGLRDPFTQSYNAYVLVECEMNDKDAVERVQETFGAAYEDGLIQDVIVSESTAQAKELMDLRDLIGETLSSHYTLHKNDISVPVTAIPSFLRDLHSSLEAEYPNFRVLVFGHVGDGNLHVNVLKPEGMEDSTFWQSCKQSDERVFWVVEQYNGSISAEHGVGLLKKQFMHYSRSAEEIHLMRGIKGVFDPKGIMNPGKVIPDL
jgi:FAD/FMN-containing dehydrogenase